MREYKFRGKMIPENEWIYGTLLRIPAPPYCCGENPPKDKYYIQFADTRYMPDWGMSYKMVQGEIKPETLGQFTGLYDKNGKEIYEGDIVKIDAHNSDFGYRKEEIRQIKFMDGSFGIYKGISEKEFYFNDLATEFGYGEIDYYEVIGNIFDRSLLNDSK